MATITVSIAGPAGSRTKTMTFPDTAAQSVMTAAQSMFPGANLSDSLDQWFASVIDGMRAQVVQNLKQTAAITAQATIANIPFT